MIDFNELKNYQKKLQQEYKDKTSLPFLKFHKEMLKKCDKWLDEVFKSPVIEENIQAAAMEAIKKEPFANHSYNVPVNFDIIVDLDCGGSVEVIVGDTIIDTLDMEFDDDTFDKSLHELYTRVNEDEDLLEDYQNLFRKKLEAYLNTLNTTYNKNHKEDFYWIYDHVIQYGFDVIIYITL